MISILVSLPLLSAQKVDNDPSVLHALSENTRPNWADIKAVLVLKSKFVVVTSTTNVQW